MKDLRAGVRAGRERAAWAFGLLLGASACSGRDVSQLTGSIQTGGPDASVAADAAGARCVPGQTLACMGVCGVPVGGYQVCAPDGRSYGQCTCPRGLAPVLAPASRGDEGPLLAPRAVGGNLGAGSIGGAGVSVAQPSARAGDVGAACQLDSACSAGLTCLGAGSTELGGEGPAGGYCTKRCSAQADCSALDPNAGCTSIAGQSLCVRLCAADAESGAKCLSRPDVSCVSAPALQQQTGQTGPAGAEQLGICAPICQSDASCGGRHCDLLTGLCSDQAATGDPIGSSCSGPDGCVGGVCLGASDTSAGICSAFCTLGAAGCGFDGSEPSIGAACLLPQVQGEGDGNRGLCFELCDSDADCRAPAACLPSPSNGRAGVCLPPAPSNGGVPEVALGAACTSDGVCGAGGTCLLEGSDLFGIGGGPPGGYCSVQCQADADCPDGGMCLGSAAEGYCFRSCDLSGSDLSGSDLSGSDLSGSDLSGSDDCGGRAVLVCGALEATSLQGTCLPQCNADSDCSGGRSCDPQTGLCAAPVVSTTGDDGRGNGSECDGGVCDRDAGVAAPAAPCTADADCPNQVCDPNVGQCVEPSVCSVNADCLSEEVCDPNAGLCIAAPPIPIGGACAVDTDCALQGLCLALGDASFCSGVCQLGTAVGCEAYGSDSFCLLPLPSSATLGVCLELCNTPADCAQTGFDCLDIGGTLNGFTGACVPPSPPAATDPTPPAAADPSDASTAPASPASG